MGNEKSLEKEVNAELEEFDVEPTEESEEEERDVLRYDISYYPSDMTLRVYLDKWIDKQLVVPDFQRKYIWDMVQASKLIESFLIGIPVPGVFLYKEHGTNKLQVVDGQQRIESVVRYFKGRFDDRIFRLKNVRSSWEGKTYDELSKADQYQLQDSVLRATVIQQLSPEDNSSIYHIFERLNTGGVKLSSMEIRKCVYAGNTFKLLEEMNKLTKWRDLIGKPKLDKRLRDVELVLRILALAENWSAYEKPMKSFLNSFMIAKRILNEKELSTYTSRLRKNFETACTLALNEIGERPFHLRGRLNLGVMDSTMSTILRNVSTKNKSIKTGFDKMLNDKTFIEAVTYNTSDATAVDTRFKLAHKYLFNL